MTSPTPLTRHERLRRALENAPVDRPPVWFMRQAGRYLPEYRAIRKDVSFETLCASPDLCLEVTLQPLDRFDLDCSIVFSDILTIPEAMGQTVRYSTGVGPQLSPTIETVADIAKLKYPDVADALPIVPKTLDLFRAARPDVPIFGFAGAPFTLLCYMVEGSGSKNWLKTKSLLWNAPEAATTLLNRIADMVGDYLELQAQHGAAAVQCFDTWAGILSVEDYKRFALPAATRALARVKSAKKLYFTRDTSPFLHLIKETGADAFALDWRVDMPRARAVLGDIPVMGNLDPTALYAPAETITKKVHDIIGKAGKTGHIFNLGHGVLPTTPIAGVQAMVDAVKSTPGRWAAETDKS
ncbi:MAG: uroporphyrinogen decarboxylase [Myxococcota bacterium]|jgi:uroporphyrinogen decarboxylase